MECALAPELAKPRTLTKNVIRRCNDNLTAYSSTSFNSTAGPKSWQSRRCVTEHQLRGRSSSRQRSIASSVSSRTPWRIRRQYIVSVLSNEPFSNILLAGDPPPHHL